MYWWWDEYLDPHDLWGQLRGISAFLTGERLADYVPVTLTTADSVRALGLHRSDRVLGWIRAADYHLEVAHRAYDQAAREALRSGGALAFEYEPPEVSGAELTVPDLADGVWTATWFSTQDGSEVGREPVTAAGGSATLAVPTFLRDLALKLTR